MQDHAARNAVKSFMERSVKYITIAMALAMIFFTLIGSYNNYESKGIILTLLTYSLPFAFGILIILDRHKSLFFAVGLYATSLGLSRVIRYWHLLQDDSLYLYVAGVVLVLLGFNLMYSGYRYIRGNSRSIAYILIGAAIFTAMLILELTFGVRTSTSTKEFLELYGFTLAQTIMNLLYMGLVWSEQIRNSTVLSRMSRLYSGFKITEGNGQNISTDEESARIVKDFCNGQIPPELEVSKGPVTAEYKFEFSDKYQIGYGLIQRWSTDKERTYLYLSDHENGSMMAPEPIGIERASIVNDVLILSTTDRRVCVFRIGVK